MASLRLFAAAVRRHAEPRTAMAFSIHAFNCRVTQSSLQREIAMFAVLAQVIPLCFHCPFPPSSPTPHPCCFPSSKSSPWVKEVTSAMMPGTPLHLATPLAGTFGLCCAHYYFVHSPGLGSTPHCFLPPQTVDTATTTGDQRLNCFQPPAGSDERLF